MSPLAVAVHFTSWFVVTIAALGGLLLAVGRSQLTPAGRSTRVLFGAGWLLMAAGAMIQGSRFVGQDPSVAPLLLRSAGITILVVALALVYRARISGLPRLAAALSVLVASEAAFGLTQRAEPGPLGGSGLLVYLLPLVGGLLVFWWLWEMSEASIQARFMAVLSVLLVLVVVAISGSMTNLFAHNIAAEALRRADQEADLQKRTLESQIAESVSRARQVAELDSVRIAAARRDPVLAATVERLQAPGGPFDTSDFMAFFDPSGAVLALSAKGSGGTENLAPEEAVALAGTKVLRSALNEVQAGSVDTLGSRKVALIGAFPIFNPAGFDAPGSTRRLAGAVAIGRVIDGGYLRQTAAGEARQAFLLDRDEILQGTLSPAGGVVPRSEKTQREIFDEAKTVTLHGTISGQEYASSYIPLEQPDGKVVAALVVSERSSVLDQTQQDVTRTVFVLALASTALAGFLSFFSASRITRPIIRLTDAAERVRAGDLNARVETRGRDEIGVLGETFDEMAASLGRLADELRTAVMTEAGLRSRFETILYSMTDGVVAVDVSGAVVAFNKEAERILGISQSTAGGAPVEEILKVTDATGKPVKLPIYELNAGAVRGFVRVHPAQEENGGSTGAGEQNGAAEPTPVEVTSAPILSESDGVVGGVAVVRDLSGEMQVENMKTAFLSNVSHELRTPLTPIKGYADLLKRKDVGREKAVTFLDGIAQSAERLERIIDMLIDFSAMEAGRLTLRKAPVDLNRVTQELVEKWRAEAPAHQFEKKGFDQIPVVEVDPKLVPLAIVELMDNAVKFSPKGGKVTVAARMAATNNGHKELRISVADHGIGIGKKELSAISESFAQVDQSATRAYGGLGLGLAYIQRIVSAHHGRLEVKSSPNKGSRFTMIFPVPKMQGKGATKAERIARR